MYNSQTNVNRDPGRHLARSWTTKAWDENIKQINKRQQSSISLLASADILRAALFTETWCHCLLSCCLLHKSHLYRSRDRWFKVLLFCLKLWRLLFWSLAMIIFWLQLGQKAHCWSKVNLPQLTQSTALNRNRKKIFLLAWKEFKNKPINKVPSVNY